METLNNGILSAPVDFLPPKNGIHVSPGWGCLENMGTSSKQYHHGIMQLGSRGGLSFQ